MTSPIRLAPRDVSVNDGQTILLYNGKSIIMRAVATKDTRFFTAWQSIVGTEAEVDAAISELELS